MVSTIGKPFITVHLPGPHRCFGNELHHGWSTTRDLLTKERISGALCFLGVEGVADGLNQRQAFHQRTHQPHKQLHGNGARSKAE